MTIKIRTGSPSSTPLSKSDGDPAPPPAEAADANPLSAFTAESNTSPNRVSPPGTRTAPGSTTRLHWASVLGIGLIFVLAAIGTYALARVGWMPLQADSPRPARLTVETRPAGAELLVDGIARGSTPATLTVAAGAHRIVVRSGAREWTLPVTLVSGADATHHVDLASIAISEKTGKISVATDPPGARVHLDGQLRGTTPLILTDLEPVEHKLSVTSEIGSAERTVSVEPGATTSVVFSLLRSSGPIAGWLAISLPFDVQVREGDAIVGAGKSSKIMLAAGRHDITLTSETLGYQERRAVEVSAGKTTALRIDPPRRSISANARPWAEVFIDGASMGQTPIANLPVAIGSHEIVFRHPEFGERRQTIVVTIQGPNRIAVDLTK